MKRASPNWWTRLKSGKTAGITTFLSSAGLIGTIATFLPSMISLPAAIIALVTCSSAGIVGAYLKGKQKLLPDSLIDEINTDGEYSCTFCTDERLREACEMTKHSYGHEYVSPEVAAQWQMKNSKAFVQITNSSGELCACFGILALSNSFMDQFIAGTVSDLQLRANDICNISKSKQTNRLYISGVIVRDPGTFIGHKRACVMIWTMMMYMKKIYGLNQERELYAVSVTKESERLMKHLGFQESCEGKRRVDKCNLYKYKLTKDSWYSLVLKIGDYSAMCRMELSSKKSGESTIRSNQKGL